MSEPAGCCEDFRKRGRYLFMQLRMVGCKTPNYCPWCGKGVTGPPPSAASRSITLLSSKLTGKTSAVAAHKAKDWPKGKPDCRLCKGQGWTLKRVGCCNFDPVACPCTKTAGAAPPG